MLIFGKIKLLQHCLTSKKPVLEKAGCGRLFFLLYLSVFILFGPGFTVIPFKVKDRITCMQGLPYLHLRFDTGPIIHEGS